MPGYNNLLPKNDELSALTKILNETANSVIDVSALDSHDLEQHEYYERMKAYKARLNGLVKWSPPYQYKNLLTEVPVPEKVLASEPISEANLLMVNYDLNIYYATHFNFVNLSNLKDKLIIRIHIENLSSKKI